MLIFPEAIGAADPADYAGFKGKYELAVSSIPFGNVGIEMQQGPSRYAVAADITLTGLIGLLVKHSSHTTVTGGEDVLYESRYRTRGKRQAVRMTYRGGALIKEELLPPDRPGKRPPVPAELKKDSVDPLTFMVKIREKLMEKSERFSINVYDGRRLTRTDFNVAGRRSITYKGKKLPVIVVTARRTPLAGFNAKELKEIGPQDPTLYMYYTDDERLIPVRLEAHHWLGTLSATLADQCGAGESCLLGITD